MLLMHENYSPSEGTHLFTFDEFSKRNQEIFDTVEILAALNW